ncbi:hypothetical protein [Formosa maritima]|uniref:Sulfatase-like hydrolase/transferase n=1 Tax=Formosa maritima TaxID=2592046 RepID=A0A5D0GKI6_9FLAO|nr:hypothetical protein [Formosa maritima]TYA58287.1 hypothetical protein FVF61_03685 [Formosa maritima]
MIKAIYKIRSQILSFVKNDKDYPILAAFSAGIYPLLYYYNSNFTLVNSWSQFLYFVVTYLLIPMCTFLLVFTFFKRLPILQKFSKYVIPVLNITSFVFLVIISTSGFKWKIITIALVIALIFAILLQKHIKKVIVFQLLMTLIVVSKLIPDFYRHITYSSAWMDLQDGIEHVKFKMKPNVYVIQPDGYTSFSELKKETYNFDNSNFEQFLDNNNFKLYIDFRSNYTTTLSSNSSMFAMKHHYYNNYKNKPNELYNTRKIITGNNPVVSIFRENNYKTFLLLDISYLLVNRPKMLYDYCNIDYSEVPYLDRGFSINKDPLLDLKQIIESHPDSNNFVFIERMLPMHITNDTSDSEGIQGERKKYLEQLEEANIWLTSVVQLISEKDPNSMIIIAADHGGFVGMESTQESGLKQTDEALVTSIFSTVLAIKWPDNKVPNFDNKLKTNVNLFRVLFSYLSHDTSYLENLEDDKSYSVIKEGVPVGVYEVINENGEVVFKKH